MRYRPFGVAGKAVSAVSLLLREAPNMSSPQAWRTLVFSAMENGINCFEVAAGLDVAALGLGEALKSVERRLLFLSWRLRGDPRGVLTAQAISQSIRSGLQKTGAGYFDLVTMDETAYETMAPDALEHLNQLKASGLCLQVGVVGDGAAVDEGIRSAAFDVANTPFSLTSDWQARRRIREASAANMTLVACEPFPGGLGRAQTAPTGRGLLGRRPEPLAGAGTYAFLHDTPGWTADEICLAYSLTEPTFATIQLELFRTEAIERMAAVTDKDLPTGVAAQIEMARFGEIADRRRA
ncbi:aldo/keto reductase [Phenylobacterium sp.]|uniref:aldo/keto reductase n=1 Tax=Phenylobacterium sp. TaxID=1871053 RepID=UPI00286A51A6|nr:aldo/keto reductase [Phenylobacterium sp.]